MKNPDFKEFAGTLCSDPSLICSFRSLRADDVPGLEGFYRGLDFDARRARFGAAVSDQSIEHHCRSIDWNKSIVLACLVACKPVAAIELHPLDVDWHRAELAFAASPHPDRLTIAGHLLQLAAFAAGKSGCGEFVIAHDRPDREQLRLLRGMGRVRVDTDSAVVDLGEYAILRQGLPIAAQ